MKTTTDNDDEDNDDAHSDENNIVRVLFCGEEFIGGFEATKRYVEASSSSSSSSDGVTVKVQNCSRERVKDMIQEYDVLVPLMTRFDEEVISSAAGGFSDHGKKLSKCKLILQFGVGLEGVAIDLATKAGIKVGRIRSDSNPNATSTAEMGVFLTLAALKRINECQISVEIKVLGSPMGESLFGATVLFVGWGRVAKAQAKMFKFGFRCKIYALRRKRERKGEEDDDEDDELLDGLYEGDISDVDLVGSFPSGRNNIVVIACTCTPENRKMVNKTFLDSLKFGEDRVPGIVVNVARGALVDERAMREACENGTVLYYATDVCYDEPVDVGGDLLSLGENGKRASNIFVTPHVGGVTVNSYERMGKIVAEYARKIVKEKRIESDECVSIVN
ncbi:unnamed protein product [Bathycoccus prasinos]|jgi:phosphoglycerate dehydrogenase-like enzyme